MSDKLLPSSRSTADPHEWFEADEVIDHMKTPAAMAVFHCVSVSRHRVICHYCFPQFPAATGRTKLVFLSESGQWCISVVFTELSVCS